MIMDLAEIITAAVEKRVGDLVEHAVTHPAFGGYGEDASPIERQVQNMVSRIAEIEIKKHEDAIRGAVLVAIKDFPSSFELSVYTKIKSK